jgi:Zn-dependent protease
VDPRIQELVLRLPVVLFSLTIHEFMHAWTAWKCGDDTARLQGRLTLNPLAHLDLVGTLCLLFAPIGWAKPVPVNPYNFGHPRRDEILVSGAGVAANFVAAVFLSMALRAMLAERIIVDNDVGRILFMVFFQAIIVNFSLFAFNLLPIPPLDGSHILRECLPGRLAAEFAQLGRYGVFILVGVVLLERRIHFELLGYPHLSPLDVPLVALMHVFAGPSITHAVFGG